MRLSYNVTGSERKSLVAAISHELNAPTNYLGAPTFAYEIGGYHIDKTGTVMGGTTGSWSLTFAVCTASRQSPKNTMSWRLDPKAAHTKRISATA